MQQKIKFNDKNFSIHWNNYITQNIINQSIRIFENQYLYNNVYSSALPSHFNFINTKAGSSIGQIKRVKNGDKILPI
jgi:hypothetical protein